MSSSHSLVLKGRILRADSLIPAAIGITGGRITAVGRDLEGDRVLDFGDRLLLPAATDVHVHFRDPGHPEKEDFTTGTRAAAAGGVTAVLDMPNTTPSTTTPQSFEEKRASVAAKAIVDFGLYAGLTADPESLRTIPLATAVKIYMGSTTGNLLLTDLDVIRQGIAIAAEHDKTIAVHAENETCIREHTAALGGRSDWLAHALARPGQCEAAAIRAVMSVPRPRGTRLHITHLSTAEGLELVKSSGVTCDATPHHLLFTRDDLAERGGVLKMNPPLRSADDRDALMDGLVEGHVDCVASDHAPHLPEEKGKGVWEAPAGVPGVETLLPLMLAAAARDGPITLRRVQEACCETPARLFGLPKGRLEVGYDADVIVVDLDRVEALDPRRLHSRCGWTPFTGLPVVFPTDVFLRGTPIVEGGKVIGEPGGGRFLAGDWRR